MQGNRASGELLKRLRHAAEARLSSARAVKGGAVAIHPGLFLLELLMELGISQAEFARAVGVSAMRISHVVKGSRPVTADLALRFGKAFDQSPQYWLNLQAAHDLALARKSAGRALKNIRKVA
jgi:addiction module HigA family antidote